MIKKLTLSFLVVFSLLVFFIPGVVRADSSLAVRARRFVEEENSGYFRARVVARGFGFTVFRDFSISWMVGSARSFLFQVAPHWIHSI